MIYEPSELEAQRLREMRKHNWIEAISGGILVLFVLFMFTLIQIAEGVWTREDFNWLLGERQQRTTTTAQQGNAATLPAPLFMIPSTTPPEPATGNAPAL